MLRQRGRDVHDLLPRRMWEADAPCMEMQPVFDPLRQVVVALVLLVAQNGVADDGHMSAQLMLAAGDRLERKPGDLLPGPVHHGVIGDRGLRHLLLAGPRFPHAVSLRACSFHQRGIDLALRRLRYALDQRPIDLAHRTGLEGAAELCGHLAAFGYHQHAGGVAIEAVHQARPWLRAVAKALEQSVEMMRSLGSALHGDSRRLVKHQEIVVLVERDGGEKGAVGLGQSLWGRRRRGRRDRQRRNANALTRNKPGACLGAAAVDPDLAGAEQLLESAMRQVSEVAAEPTVEAHAVLASLHCPRFDRRSLRHCTSGRWRCWQAARGLDPCRFRVTFEPNRSEGDGVPLNRHAANDSYRIISMRWA